MKKNELINELENLTALRINRLRVSKLVLKDKTNFLPLLQIVFSFNNKTSIKAAWVLEFVCKKQLNWLIKQLDYFVENIDKVHFDSAVRSISKILEITIQHQYKTNNFEFTKNQTNKIIETCFIWLISKHKVAIKAYSMTSLFLLGTKENWIHKELELIIIKNINSSSAAYKARGKRVLLQIKKFNKTK